MNMPTQDYGTSTEVSFQDGSLAGGPESTSGADPHLQAAQQRDAQQQQIPSYSSMFVKEMQQQVWPASALPHPEEQPAQSTAASSLLSQSLTPLQVNALLDNEVLSMTREIDSSIQATANCMGQVRQPKQTGECHMACCTQYTLPSVPSKTEAALPGKMPLNALQARHGSIKLFQETMAQLEHLADMVRDFQVNAEHASALSVQDILSNATGRCEAAAPKSPLPPFPPQLSSHLSACSGHMHHGKAASTREITELLLRLIDI